MRWSGSLVQQTFNVVGPVYLGSGDIQSGNLGNAAVVSANIASGQIGSAHLGFSPGGGAAGSGSVGSGSIQSGAVFGRALGLEFTIASGSIGANDIGSGQILSAAIASGQIGPEHIASGGVLRGNIASGQIGTFQISSGGVLSANIASGQIGRFHHISGDLTTQAFAAVDDSITTTTETVSAFFCVNINKSGLAQVAMNSLSGRWPAVGIAISGALSGGAIRLAYAGVFSPNETTPPGLETSGEVGGQIYLGISGQLSTAVPNTLSGQIVQKMGTAIRSGGIIFQIGEIHISGELTTQSRLVVDDSYTTVETVTGFLCASVTQSGYAQVAMAATSARMPAVGLVLSGGLSGAAIRVLTMGRTGPSASGLLDVSGFLGRPLYVGRSGRILPDFTLLLSGDIIQLMGTAASSGEAHVNVGIPRMDADRV